MPFDGIADPVAARSLQALDLMEDRLQGGRKWTRHFMFRDGGKMCLLGASYFGCNIGAGRQADQALGYLARAIRPGSRAKDWSDRCWVETSIADFNDNCAGYGEIERVLRAAQEAGGNPSMLKRPYLKACGEALLAAVLVVAAPTARAADPITIGFSMALTGGLAPNGRAALLAMQVWEGDINAKGGLLGRPVKLVFYDDQSNPSTVPGIYTKLLDVDKVDLVVSGFGTNMIAPALPVVMQHNRTFLGLFGLAVNSEFNYPDYFSIVPTGGPDPKLAFSKGFFEVAMAQHPTPATIAFAGADAEFSYKALEGARTLAKEAGLKIVYDRSYPPTANDYTPIVRGIQATNPDLVFVASYPTDTVGIVRAASEIGLKAKLFGGAMVGLQSTAIKTQLGSLMNGIVDFDEWLPVGHMATPEAMDFLKRYQAKSPAAGVDLLGYYLPPFAYADLQVLQQAVEGVGALDQQKLASYLHTHTLKTVVGDITFDAGGEWTESRALVVQFQNVKGNDVEQFKDPKVEVVLYPPALKDGNLIYPYSDAKRP